MASDAAWFIINALDGANLLSWSLIRFDGEQAIKEYFGTLYLGLKDLDGDRNQEIVGIVQEAVLYGPGRPNFIFDDHYVILRWNGTGFAEVQLENLPESAPEPIRELNNRAVTFAQAGLWPDAAVMIDDALRLNKEHAYEVIEWNARSIHLNEARKRVAIERGERIDPFWFPNTLTTCLVYGDYLAAVDIFRPYPPELIFDDGKSKDETSLLQGIIDYRWNVEDIKKALFELTEKGLAAMDDLDGYQEKRAAAYFLRAWGAFIVDQKDPCVIDNLIKAHQFDPEDSLYKISLDYLQHPLPNYDRTWTDLLQLLQNP